MNETKTTHYLVGPPESETYACIEAICPEMAAEHWMADNGGYQRCEVWTRVTSYPQFDVRSMLEAESENNPETAPFEECWTEWQGDERIQKLQALVNAAIEAVLIPYYYCGELLYEHKPKQES